MGVGGYPSHGGKEEKVCSDEFSCHSDDKPMCSDIMVGNRRSGIVLFGISNLKTKDYGCITDVIRRSVTS